MHSMVLPFLKVVKVIRVQKSKKHSWFGEKEETAHL